MVGKEFFLVISLGLAASLEGLPLTVVNTLDGEDVPENDDFTTHTLERLSSAATCLVASVEYTHGQQIYRKDPCEFCLCLDGEMFCWWQDCPPTLEGPCRDRSPFSPCLNGAKAKDIKPTSNKPNNNSKVSASRNKTSQGKQQSAISTTAVTAIETSSSVASPQNSIGSTVMVDFTTTKAVPKVCIVMGREYKVGDRLPHDTGNCVECVCGNGGQITCSPHQCVPLGDDINDYRPPGPRPPLSDVF